MTQHTLARIDTENLYVPQDVNPPPAYTPFPDDGSPLDLKRDKPLPPLPQEHSEEIKPAVPPKDKEDVLAILRRYDTVIILDDSVSMRDENKWTQVSRPPGIGIRVFERELTPCVRLKTSFTNLAQSPQATTLMGSTCVS